MVTSGGIRAIQRAVTERHCLHAWPVRQTAYGVSLSSSTSAGPFNQQHLSSMNSRHHQAKLCDPTAEAKRHAAAGTTNLLCAPGEIRTPNLLIRSPSFGISRCVLTCHHAHVILGKYPESLPRFLGVAVTVAVRLRRRRCRYRLVGSDHGHTAISVSGVPGMNSAGALRSPEAFIQAGQLSSFARAPCTCLDQVRRSWTACLAAREERSRTEHRGPCLC